MLKTPENTPPATRETRISDVNVQRVERPSTLTRPSETIEAKSISISKLQGETIRLDPLPPNLASQITQPKSDILPQKISIETLANPLQVIQSPVSGNIFTPQVKTDISTPNQLLNTDSANQNITISPQIESPKAQLIPQNNDLIAFKNIAAQLIQIKEFSSDLIVQKNNLEAFSAIKPQAITATIESIKDALPVFVDTQGRPENIQTLRDIPFSRIVETSPLNIQSATIIGQTPNNLPVVTFQGFSGLPEQSYIIQVPVENIVTGQRLEISPQALTNIAGNIVNAPLPSPSYFLIPDQWPLLEDILQSVRQSSAAVAQTITASIPNAANPAQITPAALFFIAALRAGDLSQILSERTQNILKAQGKSGLLSRLTQEGSIIGRTEQTSGEWRSITMPMAWDNEIQKIALHYKHDHPDQDDNDNGEKQTRFIFDLSLSRMGKVQLDGFHKDKTLNLILRTENNTSQAMQMNMKRLYHEALESASLSGELSFQNNLDSWVKVNEEEKSAYSSDI